MPTIDLLLLGMISQHPMSAYDMVRFIERHNLNRLVKISKPAVYRNVRELQRKGYLDARMSKTRRWPEKRTFALSELGREYLGELMFSGVVGSTPVTIAFNASLMFITELPKEQGDALLRACRESIEGRLDVLDTEMNHRTATDYVSRALVEQQIRVMTVLLEWLDDFADQYIRSNS